MAKKVGDYLKERQSEVNALHRANIIPSSVLRQFQIFVYYSGLTSKSKMQRYEDTSLAMGTCVRSVINAVKSMEKNI